MTKTIDQALEEEFTDLVESIYMGGAIQGTKYEAVGKRNARSSMKKLKALLSLSEQQGYEVGRESVLELEEMQVPDLDDSGDLILWGKNQLRQQLRQALKKPNQKGTS